jgi:hypothetical protein
MAGGFDGWETHAAISAMNGCWQDGTDHATEMTDPHWVCCEWSALLETGWVYQAVNNKSSMSQIFEILLKPIARPNRKYGWLPMPLKAGPLC